MGGTSSRIPAFYPGQALKLIGISTYDDFFRDLEKEMINIDYVRTELDLRFTDFIRSLGCAKLWERCPDFEEMVRIMIVVLVTNGKGKLANITYKEKSPYLYFNISYYSYYMRALINDYNEFIRAVDTLINQLQPSYQKLFELKIDEQVKQYLNNIAEEVIKMDYDTEDAMNAIRIVEENCLTIQKA